MPVDRDLTQAKISNEKAPPWKCPSCRGGILRLDRDSLRFDRTSIAHAESKEDYFGPEHDATRFVALLKCDSRECLETAAVAGTGEVREAPDWEAQKMNYYEEFTPTYLAPSPRLISVPDDCPAPVVVQLNLAFVASWGDPSGAGNRIRIAVERLLDAMRVLKVAHGKQRRRLTLHSRIERLEHKHPEIFHLLMAIKWLGNAGSHSDVLTRPQIFDALDIFEEVLERLYSTRRAKLANLVAEINRRKGPATKRRASLKA